MAFPNIPDALQSLYKPDISLVDAGNFVKGLPFNNVQPLDYNKSVEEAQKIQANDLILAEKKRAEDTAQNEEARSKALIEKFKGMNPKDISLNDAYDFTKSLALQQGELKDATAIQAQQDARQKQIGDTIGIAKQIANVDPNAGADFLKKADATRKLGLDTIDPLALPDLLHVPKGGTIGIRSGNNFQPIFSAPNAGTVKPNFQDFKRADGTIRTFNLNNPVDLAEASSGGYVAVNKPSGNPGIQDLINQMSQNQAPSRGFLGSIVDLFSGGAPRATPTPQARNSGNQVIYVRKKQSLPAGQ